MKSKINEINLEESYKDLMAYQSRFDFDFFVFTVSAALVCFFGFVMDNASIVIGAMVLSPLLYPIIAIPAAFFRKDWKNFKNSLLLLGSGYLLVILLSWILSLLIEVRLESLEIVNWIAVNHLMFFLVAFFSGLAGCFCFFWPRASSSMTGVAISIALLPPLVAFGISLSSSTSLSSDTLAVIMLNSIGIFLGSTLVLATFFKLKKRGIIQK
ncbi:MAG: DUF389 domain-containing protein [Candidatus Moranbacteria bacterium]|nr:DUF389 domain-containing protein [Candidatus Moranbacteria bacterium]